MNREEDILEEAEAVRAVLGQVLARAGLEADRLPEVTARLRQRLTVQELTRLELIKWRQEPRPGEAKAPGALRLEACSNGLRV